MNAFPEWFDTAWVRASIVGVLSILALYLLAQTITVAANFGRSGAPATDTITVRGEGQAAMPPNIARISFSVQNTAPAVSDAQAATTKQANAAIDFVKKQNIADKDVKTQYYSITPQYQYSTCSSGYCPTGNYKITGYQVSESVQITVHDLSLASPLIEGLGRLGVQNLSGPDFTLEDATAGHSAARADAIEKAKAQAHELANQLGVRLGKIVNFSESSGGYPYPMYGMGGATADSKAVAPELPTGQNTYTASVSITYEIR